MSDEFTHTHFIFFFAFHGRLSSQISFWDPHPTVFSFCLFLSSFGYKPTSRRQLSSRAASYTPPPPPHEPSRVDIQFCYRLVHTSNANASRVQYASAMEYSKMVDEVDVLVLLFFLFLGLRRIRRRLLIQRNNKSRPKRLWVREIFRKRQLFPFLSQHLPF